MKKRSLLFLCLFIIVFFSLFPAQDMSVPVDLQFRLFLKILEYDRGLQANGDDEIVIGILFQQRFRLSVLAKNQFLAAHQENSDQKIGSAPIRCIPVALTNAASLRRTLEENKIRIIYVTPLRAFNLGAIAEICTKEKITSLTGVTDYLDSGVAVAIGLENEKPKIMINLSAAKAVGSDFSSQLLNLAEVIR